MKWMKMFGLLAVVFVPVSCASVDNGGTSDESTAAKESDLSVVYCTSSQQCPAATHCSTEDGVCLRPPWCKPGSICPAVCYGTCVVAHVDPIPPTPLPGICGDKICGKGTYCCNASCGTCAPIGSYCTQQICPSPI